MGMYLRLLVDVKIELLLGIHREFTGLSRAVGLFVVFYVLE